MKKTICFLILLFFTIAALAQVPESDIYKVHITLNDKRIITEIKPVESAPSVEPDLIYYWFSSNSIKQTQGGYSGHLLNGHYQEYYLNKTLKEEGEYVNGLKNGKWKSWNENGNLTEQIDWKNGRQDGPFVLYDEKGNVKQNGKNKNGQVVEPTHTSFWDKINIFKKKAN